MSERTTIRFEHGPMMSAAHLTSDDGGKAYVFCSIPGGTPFFSFSIRGDNHTSVSGAPQCDTLLEFENFVRARWGT